MRTIIPTGYIIRLPQITTPRVQSLVTFQLHGLLTVLK